MINEDLFNEKDLIIAKQKQRIEHLERCISDFKQYDKERKEYYSALDIKVGELESYIEELESKECAAKKIKELNKKLEARTQELRVLHARGYLEKMSDMADITAIVTANKLQLQQQLQKANETIRQLRKTMTKLYCEIAKYQK
jgi:chromosome segregation ATPase